MDRSTILKLIDDFGDCLDDDVMSRVRRLAGESKAVPHLLPLLSADDPAVREKALLLLTYVGPAAADTAQVVGRILIDSGQPDDVRDQASYALGTFGISALPTLLTCLREGDVRCRENVVRQLSELGTGAETKVIPYLIESLADSDGDVAFVATCSLEKTPAAIPALEQALQDKRPGLRVRAAKTILKLEFGHQCAIQLLLAALRQSDDNLRSAAAHGLIAVAGPALSLTVKDCIQLLTDRVDDVRSMAATTLRNIGPPATLEALPALRMRLDDDDLDVIVTVLETIGDMGESARNIAPALIELVASADYDEFDVTNEAAKALGHMGSEEALPVLRKRQTKCRRLLGKDPDMDDVEEHLDIVETAIRQIIDKEPWERPIALNQSTPEELVEYLSSDDPMTCLTAQRVLMLHGERGANAASKALEDPDPDVRMKALTVLRELGQRAQETIPVLVRMLDDEEATSTGVAVNILVVRTLARIGSAAIPELRKAAKSPKRAIKDAANEALELLSPRAGT